MKMGVDGLGDEWEERRGTNNNNNDDDDECRGVCRLC